MTIANLIGRDVTCIRPDFGLERDATYRVIAHDGSFVAVERDGRKFGIRASGDFANRPTIGLDRFRVAP